VVLGPPVVAVILFEVILNATAMFNHGNVLLPGSLERLLRLFVMTPDMRATRQVSRLPGMLALPFTGKVSGYAINLREWDASNE
jgi:hypothetical protein